MNQTTFGVMSKSLKVSQNTVEDEPFVSEDRRPITLEVRWVIHKLRVPSECGVRWCADEDHRAYPNVSCGCQGGSGSPCDSKADAINSLKQQIVSLKDWFGCYGRRVVFDVAQGNSDFYCTEGNEYVSHRDEPSLDLFNSTNLFSFNKKRSD